MRQSVLVSSKSPSSIRGDNGRNEGTSEVASTAVERAAGIITEGISKAADVNSDRSPVSAEIIKTHQQGNFAVAMVPILLGFTPYIAMMAMNIHLRVSS